MVNVTLFLHWSPRSSAHRHHLGLASLPVLVIVGRDTQSKQRDAHTYVCLFCKAYLLEHSVSESSHSECVPRSAMSVESMATFLSSAPGGSPCPDVFFTSNMRGCIAVICRSDDHRSHCLPSSLPTNPSPDFSPRPTKKKPLPLNTLKRLWILKSANKRRDARVRSARRGSV